MLTASFSARTSLLAILTVVDLLAMGAVPVRAAELQQDTAKAYERYVAAAEARMAREEKGEFLHIASLPPVVQQRIWAALKRGEVWTYPLVAIDPAGREIHPPHSTVTHWAGDAYYPGASANQVLSVIQDFDHLSGIYKPEVVSSRLLKREGETYETLMRLHKDTPWVNPTFNITSTATFSQPGPDRVVCRMASTRIAQVEDAGRPGEHEDSVGRDGGYLWRMNTYWRLEERDGGVVAEWEAITLSRDIPFLLRWIVRPFVDRLARQTIRDTLTATRNEIEKRRKAAAGQSVPAQSGLMNGGSGGSRGFTNRRPRGFDFAPPGEPSSAFKSKSSASRIRWSPL